MDFSHTLVTIYFFSNHTKPIWFIIIYNDSGNWLEKRLFTLFSLYLNVQGIRLPRQGKINESEIRMEELILHKYYNSETLSSYILNKFLKGISANADPHYQKLCSRVAHIRGYRRLQPNRSAMERPRPGGSSFVIKDSSEPGKYACKTDITDLYISNFVTRPNSTHNTNVQFVNINDFSKHKIYVSYHILTKKATFLWNSFMISM